MMEIEPEYKLDVEIIDYGIRDDANLYIEFTLDNVYQQELFPIDGELKEFVEKSGWLESDSHYDQYRELTIQRKQDYKDFIENSIGDRHIKDFLTFVKSK